MKYFVPLFRLCCCLAAIALCTYSINAGNRAWWVWGLLALNYGSAEWQLGKIETLSKDA